MVKPQLQLLRLVQHHLHSQVLLQHRRLHQLLPHLMQRVKDLLPLLDADILGHECCYSGQIKEEDGTITVLPFYLVAEAIDARVLEVMKALETRLEPIM